MSLSEKDCGRKVLLPALFGEALDGVAEHGPGHCLVAPIARQKRFQCGLVPLSGLAQEPANGFVDEVVGVMEENVGDGESVFQLPMPDECHGADDTDALLP